MKSKSGVVDTIVGVDRNGHAILRDFFHANPKLMKFNFLSDNEVRLRPKALRDVQVMIFDDSIHSGKTILKTIREIRQAKPKGICLATLLITPEALARIGKSHPQIEVAFCRQVIEKNGLPSRDTLKWQFTYRDGLLNNDNPDHSKLVIRTLCRDVDRIRDAFGEIVRGILKVDYDFSVDSIATRRGSRRSSYHLDANQPLLNHTFNSICEIEWPKIRCTVATYDSFCELTVMAIIIGTFDSDKCRMWRDSPDRCLAKLAKLQRDWICGACLPFSSGWQFLLDNQHKIASGLQERGIKIESMELLPPSFGRFFR